MGLIHRSAAPAVAAGAALLAVYGATTARSVTRWDSGEFIASVHALGIPHPPGTPLYVLLARVWAEIPLPVGYGHRVNLFSAVCAAAAVTLLGMLIARWMDDRMAGAAAALSAGGTSSLWLSAAETEAYAPALLFGVLLLWIASRPRPKPALLAFVAALGWCVHPAALVLLPAAALLAYRPGAPGPRAVAAAAGAAAIGLTAVAYLYVRARHDPAINQGNPATVRALIEVLAREQYPDNGFWPRQAPLWLQIGNLFEYADWQFALGLHRDPPPSLARTSITIVFAALGLVGSVAHRRRDRRSWRALSVGFAAASVGLVLYLNLKAGPSYGAGVIADSAPREARERDYFFIPAFVIWGAWAGAGLAALARRFAPRIARAAPLAAALPLALNFDVVRDERVRASDETRAGALHMLSRVPRGGVFLAIGDNDTYPLWYLQQVERARSDVAVVTIPLLGAPWYRAELARRHGLYDARAASSWRGLDAAVAHVCERATAQRRALVLSPSAPSRKLPATCTLHRS